MSLRVIIFGCIGLISFQEEPYNDKQLFAQSEIFLFCVKDDRHLGLYIYIYMHKEGRILAS